MQTIAVNSWKECMEEVNRIINSVSIVDDDGKKVPPDDVLFRGHQDAKWVLETTLERKYKGGWSLMKYFQLLIECAPLIERHFGQRWTLPTIGEIEKELREHNAHSLTTRIYNMGALAHLRHFGFPSPLLDWSESLGVAAFFAFENGSCSADYAAIFLYVEIPQLLKSINDDLPNIWLLSGDYPDAPERHLLQQSVYTVCTQNKDFDRAFVDHENIFEYGDDHQDMLSKIIIPRKARPEVLSYLRDNDIESDKLFGTDKMVVKALPDEEIRPIVMRHV